MGRKFDTTEIANPARTLARREEEAERPASTPAQADTSSSAMSQSKFSGYDDQAKRSRTPPQHMLLRRDRNP